MKITIMILSLLVFSSCGKNGSNGTDAKVVVVEVPQVEQPSNDDIELQSVIDEENDYRLGLGQTMLSNGLSCVLQTFSAGQRIQASIPGYDTLAGKVTVGSFLLQKEFNQLSAPASDGLNVLPNALKSVYKTMFYLSCSGFIAITETNYHLFELSSDDAGLLYVGGSKLIDLDNAHSAITASSTKYLRRGVHAIKIDFAQSGGLQTLVLKHNSELLSSKTFLH